MNGKIRVSIVATSLNGSTVNQDSRPVLNVVNGSNVGGVNFSENLFSKNKIEHNVINSIDGATALRLDENYELKNNEEQNSLIDSFESKEENKIAENSFNNQRESIINNEVPAGVSIESASYIENNNDLQNQDSCLAENDLDENKDLEYTPKLFSDEQGQDSHEIEETTENNEVDSLFEPENNEDEDFEIPAFLRRQKF